MIRLLHLADVHLDTVYAGRPRHRDRLRAAQRTAFRRAIDCALEEKVHAVLIAGDLFDNDRLTLRTEHVLMTQLGRLHEAGIPCVYVTGNHDPGGSRYRAGGLDWPPSFHFIKGKRAETVEISADSAETLLRISGAGHIDDRVQDNLAEGFPAADDGVPHVGVLHTMVVSAQSSDDHARYAPCTAVDLQRQGYRYWALGHIHVRQQACEHSNAWYSGNLVGRNPKESGAKGGLLVDITDSAPPQVQFRPFAPVQWLQLPIAGISDVATMKAFEHVVDREVRRAQGDASDVSDWFVRLDISGKCALARELRDRNQLDELEEVLAESLGLTDLEIRTRNLSLPIDLDEHRGQPHVLGEVLALIGELRSDVQGRRLAELGPDDLAGEGGGEYLRELLEDLDRTAAERLLSEVYR